MILGAGVSALLSATAARSQPFGDNFPRSRGDLPFLMVVEDVFTIGGRLGVEVHGRIEQGWVDVGDALEIIGPGPLRPTRCAGLRAGRSEVKRAGYGDRIVMLLADLGREDVTRGMVLSKPGAVARHAVFEARVELLSTRDGGRTAPLNAGDNLDFGFYLGPLRGRLRAASSDRMSDVGLTGVIPGDMGEIVFELLEPAPIASNMAFDILQGGRRIGQGTVIRPVH